MNCAMNQIAIRLPEALLEQADRVADQKQKMLKKGPFAYRADRISRSSILRSALERGLLVMADELPKPSKSKTQKTRKTRKNS